MSQKLERMQDPHLRQNQPYKVGTDSVHDHGECTDRGKKILGYNLQGARAVKVILRLGG